MAPAATYCFLLSPTAASRDCPLPKTLPLLLSRQTFPPPGTMGAVAHCGGVGSASRTETLSQLTRWLVSLLLRPQAMLLVPNTFECPPSAEWGRKWSPRLPGAHCPDRQPWLGASARLHGSVASLPSQRGGDERCCAAPWRRGCRRATRRLALRRATRRPSLSRSLTQRALAPAGRTLGLGRAGGGRPGPSLPAVQAQSGSDFAFWRGREQSTTAGLRLELGSPCVLSPGLSRPRLWRGGFDTLPLWPPGLGATIRTSGFANTPSVQDRSVAAGRGVPWRFCSVPRVPKHSPRGGTGFAEAAAPCGTLRPDGRAISLAGRWGDSVSSVWCLEDEGSVMGEVGGSRGN